MDTTKLNECQNHRSGISPYNVPPKTTCEIMDFVSRRVAKNESIGIPELTPINIYHLNKLFHQLAMMNPDDDLAELMEKAMDEIELLEQREQLLLAEHEMLYSQLDERERYEI